MTELKDLLKCRNQGLWHDAADRSMQQDKEKTHGRLQVSIGYVSPDGGLRRSSLYSESWVRLSHACFMPSLAKDGQRESHAPAWAR